MNLKTTTLPFASRSFAVLMGPTASGKSALAIDIACNQNGVIINADSMQVYADLNILTARPGQADLQRAPHRLYGVIDGAERCSVGRWLALARQEVEQVWDSGKLPILVGGTGMYMQAALSGISPIPDIAEDCRLAVQAERQAIGSDAFHSKLKSLDPESANRLFPTDSQRVLRAMEVVQFTGKPLSEWQKMPRVGRLEGQALPIAYMPPRQQLYDNIERRFDQMVEKGALEEVKQLQARKLAADLPIMKALGVSTLGAYLLGNAELSEAISTAKRDTRRYAKRQMTWMRNNFISKIEINELYSKSLYEKIFSNIF